MAFRLFKLFRSAPQPTDGLTQSQREALVDLLHFCMYADNHIALAEDKVLDDAASALNWDPGSSFEAYEARSVARARAAKDDADLRADFLKSVAERLSSKASRALALNTCRQLFIADGATSEREAQLESTLKQLLK